MLRILLGITGGIAAYKAAGLIRALKERGHDVEVLPTENALRFIGKTTLEALSGNPIDIDMYSDVASVRHVELGQQADLILVAPATASFIGRLAAGIADDLLMNAILASRAPLIVCPAMHTEMWTNAATQSNVSTLESRGVRVMEPASGRLTGSDSGVGRLPEVEDIISFVLDGPLSGKSVVVTAGGTREPIDDVRYIGNRSSGRMGIELAKAARDAGARVTLIASNLDDLPKGITSISVSTVDELESAMSADCDVLIMAAAVSDYRVINRYQGKLGRQKAPDLKLEPTKDLIAEYASGHPRVYTVAFALVDDADDLLEVSQRKLANKSVDLIVGNTTKSLGALDTEVLLVEADSSLELKGSKREVARGIVSLLARRLAGQ